MVAIEFALVFLLGVLPLLMLTFSGVLIFAAKQSLTLAAANGARAALRYGSTGEIPERRTAACLAASQSMQWLLDFSGAAPDCAAPGNPPIAVTAASCPATVNVQCIKVETTYNYDAHPFIPGTTAVYGWLLGNALTSSATVQLDTSGT
ncbi:pilus assembly protein TadE [Frateuria sp. Soil773]|uniref:TadE/TadG family type IV pilus assembly protein n=1 Tax=Frateuria sp. Soil773 TaxID=1736407 RepID=UPI0006F53DD9|nr:TadE/TadG family type IV pilus assembly protein [Frateuria sp. Soil773]KRF02105.1 pilus assembly protein TadE [Frateuria sp. Soil773]